MNLIVSEYLPPPHRMVCKSHDMNVPGEGDMWRRHRRVVGPAFNKKACESVPPRLQHLEIERVVQISARMGRNLESVL